MEAKIASNNSYRFKTSSGLKAVNDDSIAHILKLIDPKLQAHIKLSNDIVLLEALHELGVNDEVTLNSLSLKYKTLLSNEKQLQALHTSQPAYLDRLYEQEEHLLLSLTDFEKESDSGSLKYRLVKHYGYEFRYDINNVDKDKPLPEPIPAECSFLWERIQNSRDLNFHILDQLTINYYKPGQGIPPHVDTHSAFEDPLYHYLWDRLL